MSTATTSSTSYSELIDQASETSILGSIGALLGWDQETMMPQGGAEYRARQLALMARMRHEHLTSPRMAELLSECASEIDLEADTIEAVNVRGIQRDYDRASKLPASLVSEIASTASAAQHEWVEARAANDFSRFLPWLEKTVELCRQKAKCFGWESDGEAWDALAEDYEPGCTAAKVSEVFGPLRERLRDLIERIASSPTNVSRSLDDLVLPVDQQMAFCRDVAGKIGFNFDRGRLDVSAHPFCGGSHCQDVRMTTRFHENMITDALSSTMHECGHGIYEQGLGFEHVGTPMCDSVSLGIHESQSRMWENQVGRSREFWEWCAPRLSEFFGDAVKDITPELAYQSANRVAPGFIRVEADEATYNMHIMIRFELERLMMNGELLPKDLPGERNRMYREYLGLEVVDDSNGCMQDVHWSMGALGYFPTYTLGNLYCAQFFEQACESLPGLENDFRNGQFDRLKVWLNENIHQHARRYTPSELCERITGKALSADPLMRYLEGKLSPMYGI
mgnify:CR=1 FL=1